jgi:hydrogenase maturation factor
MCLSVPGKIVEIRDNGSCVVDYVAEKRDAQIFNDEFKVGDYVVVSNKIVIMKVPEEEAREYLNVIGDS